MEKGKTETKTLTVGSKTKLDVSTEIASLIRARAGVLWISSVEEFRVKRSLRAIAQSLDMEPKIWSCTTGTTDVKGKKLIENSDPDLMLQGIFEKPGREIWVIQDLGEWVRPPGGSLITRRLLRDAVERGSRQKRDDAKAIVIIDSGDPPDIPGIIRVEFPLPNREQVEKILDDALEALPKEIREDLAGNGNREEVLSALLGLTSYDAEVAISCSVVRERRLNPAFLMQSKKKALEGSALEWFEPEEGGFASVGGLDGLKEWAKARRRAFTDEARNWGLPSPKGILVAGIPGSGKSLFAKALAQLWGLAFIRLDVGAIYDKYVGGSEANFRKVIQVAETVAPCILWIDEIEKGFAGSQTSGATDGGTTSRVFGSFLTWLQERTAPVFVIATANNVEALPPEFTRAGRWDQIFWVDCPNSDERKAIVEVMKERYAPANEVEADPIVEGSIDYTGAEIEAAFIEALNNAFDAGQDKVTTENVVAALKTVTPIVHSTPTKMEALREWAKKGARPASITTTAGIKGTNLELGRSIEF